MLVSCRHLSFLLSEELEPKSSCLNLQTLAGSKSQPQPLHLLTDPESRLLCALTDAYTGLAQVSTQTEGEGTPGVCFCLGFAGLTLSGLIEIYIGLLAQAVLSLVHGIDLH